MTRNCLIFISIAVICCCSCSSPRFIYSPSPPNNPYFKETGDSKLAAYYSSGGDDNKNTGHKNNGLDLQAAYAISDHWALTAGFLKGQKETFTRQSGITFLIAQSWTINVILQIWEAATLFL